MERLIGLVGLFGSGKGTVARILVEGYGFEKMVFSDLILDEAERRWGRRDLSVKELQDMGNLMREEHGGGVLMKRILEKVSGKGGRWIADGVRNVGEVEVLKAAGGVLIAVEASRRVRFKRSRERGRDGDPKTWKEFVKLDERAAGKGEAKTGQRVVECLELADWKIKNESNEEELRAQIGKLMEELL